MSTNKKRIILNTLSVKLGCSCRRPKLSDIFNPKPRRKRTSSSSSYKKTTNSSYFSSSHSWDNTPTTFSSILEEPIPAQYSSDDTESCEVINLSSVQGFGKIGCQSTAVEKDSDDPYFDFRQSMLQMIIDREINTKNDLKDLLNCFLQLNSPYYHAVIVRAFMDICNGK